MKYFTILCLTILSLCGCVDKHPYKYSISEDITKTNKEISNWQIQEIENGTNLPMSPEKKYKLTNQIHNYLKTKGFNTSSLSQGTPNSASNIFVIKPKIIQTMAQISQNMAGWHGTSEDPLNFWSHFSGGSGMQFVDGAAEALSLYIEIYSMDKKYYENAGGIELVGKFNKYSFRTTNKLEPVEDNKKFQKAISIAFKPLIDTVK
jgi:hypothetical protein